MSGAGAAVTVNIDSPVIVANGGSGRTSHTEYAVICGGTTTTAAQQSIASVGTSGQVLTSNGAAALPTFQAAGGGDVTKVGTPVDNQIGVWTGDGTIEGDSSFLWDGTGLKIEEVAAAAADTANFGQVWVKNTTPNELYFTDDAGTDFQLGVGGGMPEMVVGGEASSHSVNTTTAFAPVSYRDFGSVEMLVRSFDDTGPEYMQSSFRVPADLGAGASSVTFEIMGSAATAAASKNVKFTFDFLEVADDGLMTGAYGSSEVWDDQSISATQDDMDIISNTETITNLGWTAGNMIYYRLYRSAATTTNLSGDYDVISFYIRIPQA